MLKLPSYSTSSTFFQIQHMLQVFLPSDLFLFLGQHCWLFFLFESFKWWSDLVVLPFSCLSSFSQYPLSRQSHPSSWLWITFVCWTFHVRIFTPFHIPAWFSLSHFSGLPSNVTSSERTSLTTLCKIATPVTVCTLTLL